MGIQQIDFGDRGYWDNPSISDSAQELTVFEEGWQILKGEYALSLPDPLNKAENLAAAKKLQNRKIEELKPLNQTLVCKKSKHKSKHKSTLGKLGHKVSKFWKKHKKEILITTAVVVGVAVAVTVVAVTCGGATAGVAAGAASGAAALSDSKEKSPPKQTPPSQLKPLSQTPSEPSALPPIDYSKISYPFQTFNPTPLPKEMALDGYNYGSQFGGYPEMHPGTTFNGTSFQPAPYYNPSYHSQGEWALSNRHYTQSIQSFNKAIEAEPQNSQSYLGRGAAHFELGKYDACVADYNQYTTIEPKEFSMTDFSIGFAKGMPKGVCESGESMLLFLGDLVKNPVQTGAQVYESFSSLSQLMKSGEWETIGKALSPEIHELVTQWETLSDSKKGELAGYAFGKHGSDILLPGTAAKVVTKSSVAIKELSAACKNLQAAERVFVLEAVASGSGTGMNVGEVIVSAQKTISAGEDLGLTTKQIAEFKQSGTLEEVIGKGRDYFAGKPELQASYDLFKNAKIKLDPYVKQTLSESEIKILIEQTGIKTFSRPKGIPENYRVQLSSKGAAIIYVHPEHTYTSIRVMPGKAHSPFPHQQKPYIKHMKNGDYLDKYGKKVPENSAEAHIPLHEYVYLGD